MDTSREDVGIAIRSAFLKRGTQQRFSLFVLVILSILFIFLETIDSKPLNLLRSFVKDVVYRSAVVVSIPFEGISNFAGFFDEHINLHSNYKQLIEENKKLQDSLLEESFLQLENSQLRKLIDEQVKSSSNLVSARVIIDKQSPYLNSFVINIGNNKNIKNGMSVLDGKNFIGRIVDVNYFSSRVLLVTDLNSKIPAISNPKGIHAILSGHGTKEPSLDYLPKNHSIEDGDLIFTSGREGIFSPGIPIGKVKIFEDKIKVKLFSDLTQITFVIVNLSKAEKEE